MIPIPRVSKDGTYNISEVLSFVEMGLSDKPRCDIYASARLLRVEPHRLFFFINKAKENDRNIRSIRRAYSELQSEYPMRDEW